MARRTSNSYSWRIALFVGFISVNNLHSASSQSQQYSTPILSPNHSQNQQTPAHLRLGQLLSQDSSGSSSAFAGSGFPPARLPPPGESFSYAGSNQHHPPPPPLGLPDYDSSGSGDPIRSDPNHGQVPAGAKSKTVSGDYCWDPLFSCDTQRTILYCIVNRCTCPTGWTLTPGNIPLNTVWDPASNRCLSLLGSGCHVLTLSSSANGNGYVHCQPGVRCVPHPNLREVGTCGAANNHNNIAIVLVGVVLSRILFINFVPSS